MKDAKSKIYFLVASFSFIVFLVFIAFIVSGKPNDTSVSVSGANDVLFTGVHYSTANYDQSEQVLFTNFVDIQEGAAFLAIGKNAVVAGNAPIQFSARTPENLEILSGTLYIQTEKLTAIRIGSSDAFFLEPQSSAIIDTELRSIIILSGFGSFAADMPVIKGESVRWEVDAFNIIDFDTEEYVQNSELYNTFYFLYQIEKLPVEYRYVIDNKSEK